MAICRNLAIWTLAAGVSLWLAGCNSTEPSSSDGSGTTADSHDHGHEGHDHAHDHAEKGPHGGDIMVIGKEEYHAEWKLDEESGAVMFYILDAEAKNEVPIAGEKIEIEVTGGTEPKTYELHAVNPSADDMKTAQFEAVDKELIGALQSIGKEGPVAMLNVVINGKPFSQKIEKEAHDHGHDHAHDHAEKPAK